MARSRSPFLACLLLLALSLADCGPSDPREQILSDRARWTLTPLSWSMTEDGRITLNARLLGPVRSQIDRLTVRIELRDAQGTVVDREWWTLDLSGIQRGGPEDVLIRLPAREVAVEELTIDPVLDPTPEEISHIEELQTMKGSSEGPLRGGGGNLRALLRGPR